MARPALTVIGLDAATFDVVDPLVAAGDLPHLARLLERGASGVLRSTTHPLTPHAWSTMVTGVNAGQHGIWDFTERDDTGYGLRLINGSYRRAPALWDRLARPVAAPASSTSRSPGRRRSSTAASRSPAWTPPSASRA